MTGLWSLLAIGFLAGGLVRRGQLFEIAGLATPVAIGAILSAGASRELLGEANNGYGLLAPAAAHLLVAAAVWRWRNLASCFWTAGLVLGTASAFVLLDGTWVVVALAVPAAAAAALGRLLPEPRLWLASAGLTATATAWTLARLAEPADLVVASQRPAVGVPALVLVGAAALLLSLRRFEPADELDRSLDEAVDRVRTGLMWALAAAALYGASLGILGLVEALSTTGERTEFQRGHTAVSAFWGVIAFSALLVGLRRGLQVVRLAALGLFALALGKLFLYDLSTLSSVTRALSFLAVGAVLLLAGFFYQRLSSETPA